MDPWQSPNLKFLHSESSLNGLKLELFRRLSSDELKASLAPGRQGSLKVRPDGTVLDGHHRLSILVERGEDIHRLPREIIEREP
jgi:hypothetical protein